VLVVFDLHHICAWQNAPGVEIDKVERAPLKDGRIAQKCAAVTECVKVVTHYCHY